MFKLESYITPILLSYVDKYIKNFRPEDSQVSLWGGDASFHNLDLRLEVLEQELQLPFSFVSGHIHELLIHVPWTKLASEPITITINTIECILKLRGSETSSSPEGSANLTQDRSKKAINKKQNIEAPPGYVQSLVNKIVSNIRIYCNNLILKYVEEDIVLSMNVKLLTFESACEKWKPAYIELSQAHVNLRKIINIHDLTVCLDKRNASGKIEVYQEPMLYRCSMVMHLLRTYHSATAKRASTTRLDLYCNQMEFSMTEQQIPMLIRLMHLLLALHRKELKTELDSRTNSQLDEETDRVLKMPSLVEGLDNPITWAGWAWSFLPSVLPVSWDEEWEKEQEEEGEGHTVHFGFYVDDATLTFKVSESSSERSGYYSQRKLKYWPLLTVKLQGIFSDVIMHDKGWFHASSGISQAILIPVGFCSCSENDVPETGATIEYLKAGSISTAHKSESLFDAEAPENKGEKKVYNVSWEHHMDTTSEATLLERTPAFCIDYLYQLIIPDDMTNEQLSELGSDLEYSNLSERSTFRLVLGPVRLRLCSGLLHRISTLRAAASSYDYPPYSVPRVEKPLSELLPPSEDDYDALSENIPRRTLQFTVLAPVVEFHLMDHGWFEATKGQLYKKRKKSSPATTTSSSNPSSLCLPILTVECQCIDVRLHTPMYVDRLLQTTCQLPNPPRHMFEACYAEWSGKVIGFCSRLVLASKRHTYVVTPSSASCSRRQVYRERYWIDADVTHEEFTLESECLTVTGTYPKIVVIALIVNQFLKRDCEESLNVLRTSSLIEDATRDFGMIYLEICIEAIRWKRVRTATTMTIDTSLGSVKAFIFNPNDFYCAASSSSSSSEIPLRNATSHTRDNPTSYSTREIEQVLFISGPESGQDTKTKNNQNDTLLFSATLQYPLNPDNQPHPPILLFNLQEIRICVDPLLKSFSQYSPRDVPSSKTEVILDFTPCHPRSKDSILHFPQQHQHQQPKSTENIPQEEPIFLDVHETIYNFLKKWFDVWKGLLLYGDISQCTVYLPVATLSAVGSQGIQEAVDVAMTKDNPPYIVVVTLPSAVIRSSTLRHGLSQYVTALPVKVPETVWNKNKFTFPWSVTVSGLSSYTWLRGRKLNSLKPVTLTATVGLSTSKSTEPRKDKDGNSNKDHLPSAAEMSSHGHEYLTSSCETTVIKSDIGTLGVCVHIDVTPIVLSTSEIQVCLVASVLHGLVEVLGNILPALRPHHQTHTHLISHHPNNNITSTTGKYAGDVLPLVTSQQGGGSSSVRSPSLLRENSNSNSGIAQLHGSGHRDRDRDRRRKVEGGGGSEDNVTMSTTTTTTTTTADKGMMGRKDGDGDDLEVKLTAWVQWTVARFTVELLAHEEAMGESSNGKVFGKDEDNFGKNAKLGNSSASFGKKQNTEKSSVYSSSSSSQPQLKLVMDAEDIVSSLDFQSVFLKLKSKIGAASIQHYLREKGNSKWKPGAFLGIVLKTRQDSVAGERSRDDTNFANITITRASCNHTHSLWGTVKKTNKSNKPTNNAQSTITAAPPSRYITEIVVTMQPIDLLLSPTTLKCFYQVLEPLSQIPQFPNSSQFPNCSQFPNSSQSPYSSQPPNSFSQFPNSSSQFPNSSSQFPNSSSQFPNSSSKPTHVNSHTTSSSLFTSINTPFTNRSLPLAYLECGGFRVTIPSVQEQHNVGGGGGCGGSSGKGELVVLHDTCVFQVEGVTLSPQAVNPICRTPCRPDLYQQAAQGRILNVPGSDLEDRQYQLDITGIALYTGRWSEFSSILDESQSKGSHLKTMSENPALEWNNLGKNKLGSVPNLKLWPIIGKFDLSVIAAPAMIYKTDIICGHSIELNFISDILLTISLSQIKLASALLHEFSSVFDILRSNKANIERPKVIFPYPNIPPQFDEINEEIDQLDAMEVTRDSGFETSDLKSSFSMRTKDSVRIRKISESDKSSNLLTKPTSSIFNNLPIVPLDVLVAAGKFSFVLYQYDYLDGGIDVVKFAKKHPPKKKQTDADKGYEASEEGSVIDDHITDTKLFKPLLFISLQQPNAYLSQLQLGHTFQLSIFDVRVKASSSDYPRLRGIPTESDFPLSLVETRAGLPNPDNGIPPALCTLKWASGLGKTPSVAVEVARPLRLVCGVTQWRYVWGAWAAVSEGWWGRKEGVLVANKRECNVYGQRKRENTGGYPNFSYIKTKFRGISHLNLKLAQVMFTFKTKAGPELTLTIGKLTNSVTLSTRPDKLTKHLHVECVTLAIIHNDSSNNDNNSNNNSNNSSNNNRPQLLLNPWTASCEVAMFWEPWQLGVGVGGGGGDGGEPQFQIAAESDAIVMDVSGAHVRCVEMVVKEVREFVRDAMGAGKRSDDEDREEEEVEEEEEEESPVYEKEQHYKDDLRAGAFQFVDATSGNLDELPLPYQVMFWTRNVSAMAWRYPQPRALTKVRVFPVPFKVATTSAGDHPDNNATSHSDSGDVQIVCSLQYWSECHGCYRPYTQFHLSESDMCVVALPQCEPQPAVASTWRVVLTMPPVTTGGGGGGYGYAPRLLVSPRALAGCIRVDSYFNRKLVPNLTLALHVSMVQLSLYNHIDKNLEVRLPECLSQYSLHTVIPDSQCFLTVIIDNADAFLATWDFKTAVLDVNSTIRCNVLDYGYLTELVLLEPFTSKLELSYAQTLGVNFIAKPIQLRFGAAIAHTLAVSTQMWSQSLRTTSDQTPTPSTVDIILMTHYVICNDTNVNLRFGQAGHEDIFLPSRCCHLYSWRSQKYKQLLRVALEEYRWVWSEPFRIDKDGTDMIMISEEQLTIVVTVKSVSATQKQVTFSGQLIVCNTLLEHFELRVVECTEKEKDKDRQFKKSQSYIVGGKSTPPSIILDDKRKKHSLRLRFFGLESAWSGDIPLMENTKCAQPWLVKVPLQERGQFLSIWCRIVVQKFPKGNKILAMLWPLFMVRSNLPVAARVQIETPTLNVHLVSVVKGRGEIQQLYCPGTIDHSHQLTFQIDSGTPTSNPYVPLNYSLVDQNQFFKKAEKEDINEILATISNYEKSTWPYFKDEFEDFEYVIDDPPLTQVQVRYQNACPYSSALLVELLPWCLLVNTLGCTVAIIVNEKEMCRINHRGILAPPKLEETFYFGVGIGGTWNLSLPLQLAKSDWSQSFYMPKITGTIPLDGCIKTAVKCDPYICMVSINSYIMNEIRLVKISSTHVLTSHLNVQLYVACFAVAETEKTCEIPKHLEKHVFSISPHLDKSNSGVSIIQWLDVGNTDIVADYALYMSFSTSERNGWSCPIRVDKSFVRTSLVVKSSRKNIPILLISQENKGQFYLSIHHDMHPQLQLENNSGMRLFCAQMTMEKDQKVIVKDCVHFKWLCSVEDCCSTYYTMPVIGEKFPDLTQNSNENLVLASDPEGDPQGFQWSSPINITNFNDQFIRIPFYGDIKVSVINSAHTIRIVMQSVSQAEISARDIRVRLSLHETEQVDVKNSLSYIIQDTDSSDSTLASSYFSAEESMATTTNSQLSAKQQQTVTTKLPTVPEQRVNVNKHHQQRRQQQQQLSNIDSDVTLSRSSLLHHRDSGEVTGGGALRLLLFLKQVTCTLTSDLEDGGAERTEVASMTWDNVSVTATRGDITEVCVTMSDLQIDNQMYPRGSFDFPVVLVGQKRKSNLPLKSLNVPIMQLILEAQNLALIRVDLNIESWQDEILQKTLTDIRDVKIKIQPLSAYIEDVFVFKLKDHLKVLLPTKLVIWQPVERKRVQSINTMLVDVGDILNLSAVLLAKPVVLDSFAIEPLSILLSVHSSIRLYIALDHSPLNFGRFGKKRIITTQYRLGHALTMHYLSGALFGAGWVVGSLELLGSPGGLARAMGHGLRDFVTIPYHGMVQGPWAFLKGVTHGSASLMRHVTAGTLQSVTKLAASVARNLDRLTLDEEHVRRTEEQRRQRPQGLAQGLLQGLTGLGISLLGAVGGIAHHPLQSVMQEGASPRSLVAGVGLGLVGVFTKPLSGAAELLALTGEGLLQGAGWNTLPTPRSHPVLCHMFSAPNAGLKYRWKYVPDGSVLYVTEATAISPVSLYEAVALVLTRDALVIVNLDEDLTQRVWGLGEVVGVGGSDPTLLSIRVVGKEDGRRANLDDTMTDTPMTTAGGNKGGGTDNNHDDECGEGCGILGAPIVVEMDQACRARVADYVRSTVGLLQLPDVSVSPEHSEMSISPNASPKLTSTTPCNNNSNNAAAAAAASAATADGGGGNRQQQQTTLTFYVNPQCRNYFLCLLALAKQQLVSNMFPVL